jgi:type I restriction enzyme, S subunit
MMEWTKFKLKDLVELKQGFALNKKSDHYLSHNNSGIPLLKISDLINGIETLFVKESIPRQFLVYPHEIIYSRTGQVGLAFMGKTGVVYNNCFKVIPGEKVHSVYLFHWLNQPAVRDEIRSLATGAAQPDLNHDAFKSVKINLPPLPTQKRIASILSAYDDLIENNLKRIKLLEEIAQRTYEEWFVKFRVNGKQLSIDESTGLPLGWNYEPFNKIVEIISGFPFKSSDYVVDGKYKIVTIKNVQDGYFVPETTDSLLAIPTKVKAEQVLNTEDIIVSLTGNVGRICLVYGDNYLLNQRVAKVIPLDEYSKAYVYFLLRSKAMLTSLENLSNGAAQQNLSPINMGNMKVNIPDKKLIMKFGELANSIIDLISTLNLENQKLKQSRDILLPRLMSGTINVES